MTSEWEDYDNLHIWNTLTHQDGPKSENDDLDDVAITGMSDPHIYDHHPQKKSRSFTRKSNIRVRQCTSCCDESHTRQ